jgi:hypothetical protein
VQPFCLERTSTTYEFSRNCESRRSMGTTRGWCAARMPEEPPNKSDISFFLWFRGFAYMWISERIAWWRDSTDLHFSPENYKRISGVSEFEYPSKLILCQFSNVLDFQLRWLSRSCMSVVGSFHSSANPGKNTPPFPSLTRLLRSYQQLWGVCCPC